VPYSRGDLVSRIHAEGDVLSERHEPDGTAITATVPAALSRQLVSLAIPEASG
jgi:GTP-binding protein HflX